MSRTTLLGGIGGIAFGVLTFIALFVASPPGGSYTASDATSYVASGHRAAVFVSAYLVLIGSFGLICLLARMRVAIGGTGDEQSMMSTIFWGTGVAATAAFAVGWMSAFGLPLAYAYAGDGFSISAATIYAITETGSIIVYGGGGVLLGIALIVFALGSPVGIPAWLRWVTLIAGVLGLASFAFFPWFALLLWAVITGIWLIVADRTPVRA